MPTAQESLDLRNFLEKLEPSGKFTEDYINLMVKLFEESDDQATAVLTTKGDIAVFNSARDRKAVGANNEVLVADSADADGVAYKRLGLVLGGSEIKHATADTDFNNTEAMADITGLETSSLPIGKYLVEAIVLGESATGVPELDLLFVGSVNTTLVWQVGTPAAETVVLAIASQGRVLLSNQVSQTVIHGYLDVVDTPGTLKLQGGQGTATVEDTTVSLGSTLKVTKIA